MDDVKKLPAIGISIVCDLPPGKQMTLQTFFEQDATDADANALIDRLTGFANRQRAIAELPQMREDLERQVEALARMNADTKRLEDEHPGRIARLKVQITSANDAADRITQAAYQRAAASGRTVDARTFEPKGADAQALRSEVLKADEVQKEIARLEAERAQGLEQFTINKARFEKEIAAITAKISDAEALVG